MRDECHIRYESRDFSFVTLGVQATPAAVRPLSPILTTPEHTPHSSASLVVTTQMSRGLSTLDHLSFYPAGLRLDI